MKVTLEYLRDLCNQMAEKKVEPLPVYIAIIGDKKFMCPVSSLPDNLAPLPCEIVGAQFPVEAGGTSNNTASAQCKHHHPKASCVLKLWHYNCGVKPCYVSAQRT